jgi:hypothetical protein
MRQAAHFWDLYALITESSLKRVGVPIYNVYAWRRTPAQCTRTWHRKAISCMRPCTSSTNFHMSGKFHIFLHFFTNNAKKFWGGQKKNPHGCDPFWCHDHMHIIYVWMIRARRCPRETRMGRQSVHMIRLRHDDGVMMQIFSSNSGNFKPDVCTHAIHAYMHTCVHAFVHTTYICACCLGFVQQMYDSLASWWWWCDDAKLLLMCIPASFSVLKHTYIHTYTPTFIHSYKYIHIYIHTCSIWCACIVMMVWYCEFFRQIQANLGHMHGIHTRMHAWIHTYMHTYVHAFIHTTYIYACCFGFVQQVWTAYIYMHIHACTYI